MVSSYWLVYSNKSKVKRFIENINNKEQSFKYMFNNSGKVTSSWGKEPAEMRTSKELKKDAAGEEWKKINCSGLEKNHGRLDKKRELGLLILNSWQNNSQFVTNSDASDKRFILFKLFLHK